MMRLMSNKGYLSLFFILLVITAMLGYLAYPYVFPKKAANVTNTPSSSTTQNNTATTSIFTPLPEGATRDQRTQRDTEIRNAAVATNKITISGQCTTDPKIIKMKNKSSVTLVNTMSTQAVIKYGTTPYTIPANDDRTVTITATQGLGAYAYRCGTSSAIAGYFYLLP